MKTQRLAVVMGSFFALAGIMHFVSPGFFDDIVPPWLPPSERFWTYLSGIGELVVAAMVLRPSTRRKGAYALIGVLIAVYPANLYMVWDWRNESGAEQFVSWARLPLQFVLIWLALRIAQNTVHDRSQGIDSHPA